MLAGRYRYIIAIWREGCWTGLLASDDWNFTINAYRSRLPFYGKDASAPTSNYETVILFDSSQEAPCECGHPLMDHHRGFAVGLETYYCDTCGCPEFSTKHCLTCRGIKLNARGLPCPDCS